LKNSISPHRKVLGIFRNPQVRQELCTLDPATDHQKMVQYLSGYEFPWDMVKALEMALFHTYASPEVSKLLHATGEFRHHGQKRYDDTQLLVGEFMQSGYESELGRRAIAQMNHIHGHYKISNEAFLFVLSTFVFYPIDWINAYGWRRLGANEEEGIFVFFREIGRRMNLQDLPETLPEFRDWAAAYEEKHLHFAETNREVADATVKIVENWFPPFLRFGVRPAVSALIPAKLRVALGYSKPPPGLKNLLQGILWLRKQAVRWVSFDHYPHLLHHSPALTYPGHEYEIENLGPERLRK
jgi:ER-bound oxygenase mpaB/B'/Rubber oxygenase, catalytic domain